MIELVYHVKGDVDEAKLKRAIELSETKYCSVEATLRAGVPIRSRYVIEPQAAGCRRGQPHARFARTVPRCLRVPARAVASEALRVVDRRKGHCGTRARWRRCARRRHPLPHLPPHRRAAGRRGHRRRRGRAVRPASQRGAHAPRQAGAGRLSGTDFTAQQGGGRPAKLYRLGDAACQSSASRRAATSCWPSSRWMCSPRAARARTRCACAARPGSRGPPLPGRPRAAPAHDRPPRPSSVRACRREPGSAAGGPWRATAACTSTCATASSARSAGGDPDLACAMHRAFLEGVAAGRHRRPRRPRVGPRRVRSAAAAIAASWSAPSTCGQRPERRPRRGRVAPLLPRPTGGRDHDPATRPSGNCSPSSTVSGAWPCSTTAAAARGRRPAVSAEAAARHRGSVAAADEAPQGSASAPRSRVSSTRLTAPWPSLRDGGRRVVAVTGATPLRRSAAVRPARLPRRTCRRATRGRSRP